MKKSIRIECTGSHQVKLSDLVIIQGNLKELSKSNYLKLKKQIDENGFSAPFFVWDDKKKLKLLDGNQRLRALLKMEKEGYQLPKTFPSIQVDAANERHARKKLLSFVSQYGHVTDEGLYEFAVESGFDADFLEQNFDIPHINIDHFVSGYFKTEPDPTEDEVPPVPDVPRTKPGEIYELGSHRLMCGDSTNPNDVAKLMNGSFASVWASDPPYGINHVDVANEKGQAKGYKAIANDDIQDEKLQEFIFKSISASLPHMKKGFAFYMWHAMKMQSYFAAAAAAGVLFHRQIIWVKPQFVFGRGQYHWRHELCLMGWLTGNEPPFYGEKNQSTVWEMGRENDKIHPTQKPVAIWEPAILNHTKKGEIIYEPFAGSGSNIIACEKNERACFAIEIDPHYCDVIISRWEQFAGKKAKLIQKGSHPPSQKVSKGSQKSQSSRPSKPRETQSQETRR